jgi:hypothetical protein
LLDFLEVLSITRRIRDREEFRAGEGQRQRDLRGPYQVRRKRNRRYAMNRGSDSTLSTVGQIDVPDGDETALQPLLMKDS